MVDESVLGFDPDRKPVCDKELRYCQFRNLTFRTLLLLRETIFDEISLNLIMDLYHLLIFVFVWSALFLVLW